MEDVNLPYWQLQAKELTCENITIPKKELEERYVKYAVIPERLFFKETEKAVELYEENIKPGCYPAMHSFDRLLVIYRRTGEYKKRTSSMQTCYFSFQRH